VDIKRITDLISIVATSPLNELEILDHDGWLKLVKRSGPAPTADFAAPRPPAAVASPTVPKETTAASNIVYSPMNGIVYHAPAPGESPFATEGSEVAVGQTLALIEAMKTLCKIEAERAGIVRRIFVDNGASVEEGQALFEIA
jgi:acetyl-CoA carboxylase biotin carboxyl carrier protein